MQSFRIDVRKTEHDWPVPAQRLEIGGPQRGTGEYARIELGDREQVSQHRSRRFIEIVARADA